MAGKRGLIMGLANDKSIAWGIAKALAAEGAQLAFSYQGDALKKRVDPLAAQLGSDLVLPCDVSDEGSIDRLFFPESLPAPTLGTPGLLWASLTLALLAVPVVIVATEEGLARIPRSLREGSLALGATKVETLWRVVLPMASPAMMTGLILAVARAAGEVAPLMLVGVVKLAPSLPVDGNYPYLHLDQKIMHLGFHIYDVGFQSPNVEAARPLVYATALLLVIVIALLNLTAVYIRNHLREKYKALDH